MHELVDGRAATSSFNASFLSLSQGGNMAVHRVDDDSNL
jgi:hypothetical protein